MNRGVRRFPNKKNLEIGFYLDTPTAFGAVFL